MNITQQLICLLLLATITLSAQLPAPNSSGVAMGHLHFLVSESDYDLSHKLWVEGLGARPAMVGPLAVLILPDTVIILKKAEPGAGTEKTSVNHLAFLVKDRVATEKRWTALGGQIYERRPSPDQVFFRFPGDIKVELTEDKSLDVPVRHHHIHFYTSAAEETRAWYVKTFGAKPGMRGKFLAADLPGTNLSFSEAKEPVVGTKGSAVDHIGFEVDGLEAFCQRLEASGTKFDSPYRYLDNLKVGLAFFTDPWGTYIELTEGLDKLR
jgi:catechol 2,3-dioxygenase-like lactoylglutathione lyase family enzyme